MKTIAEISELRPIFNDRKIVQRRQLAKVSDKGGNALSAIRRADYRESNRVIRHCARDPTRRSRVVTGQSEAETDAVFVAPGQDFHAAVMPIATDGWCAGRGPMFADARILCYIDQSKFARLMNKTG